MPCSDLPDRVREQKALARRNQTVRNLVLLVGVLVGLPAGGVWAAMTSAHDVSLHTSLLVGVFAGATLAGALAAWRSTWLFPRLAACPSCNHSWEIREERTVPPAQRMPNWDHCPSCGLLMNETLLEAKLRADAETGRQP